MSAQPEQQVSALRYPLAVLACAAVVCVWVPVLIGVGWFFFEYLGDWIDRQIWIVRLPLQCIVGLTILVAFFGGWEAMKSVWTRITLGYESRSSGRTHGRHARWRPGYDPKKEPGAEEGAHGRCPRCGFSYQWDGTRCGHCRFGDD